MRKWDGGGAEWCGRRCGVGGWDRGAHAHPPAPAQPQAEPEKVQAKLEAFLKGKGIPFSYSKSTKFANWIHKTLV